MRHENENANPRHTYRIDPKTGRRIRWSKTGLINPNGRGNFMSLKKLQKATRAPNGTVIAYAPTRIGAKGDTNRRVLWETLYGYYHATKGFKSYGKPNKPLPPSGWQPKRANMLGRLFGAGAINT